MSVRTIKKLLVANRGEIAIRILRAAEEMGIFAIALFSEDDAEALHVFKCSEAVGLKGAGPEAYLDMEQIVSVALENDCDAIHPGYGFLSENPVFAGMCRKNGLTFVGPTAETIELLGDKTRARDLAKSLDIPVTSGLPGPVTADEVREFLSRQGSGCAVMIKAIGGGGGRGMRVARTIEEVEEAFTQCRSEAMQAFGNDNLYVESFIDHAKHVEVQIVGDAAGNITHLEDRECSIQRNFQKMLEIAPCPGLPNDLREQLFDDAIKLSQAVNYQTLGTIEFLVNADHDGTGSSYTFMEANTRLQVEHTVTEEVFNLDLVKIQLQLASGLTLSDIGLGPNRIPEATGYAIQARINMETLDENGMARPSQGVLDVFEIPSGRGIRTDTFGYAGYETNPNFDSLLAKLICHSETPAFSDVVSKTYRALGEFRIEGVQTNIPFLQNLLSHADFQPDSLHTGFVASHIKILTAGDVRHENLFFTERMNQVQVGARVDESDPLAVLDYGKNGGQKKASASAADFLEFLEGGASGGEVKSYLQGTIIRVNVEQGDLVQKEQGLMVISAMKMEHVIRATASGCVKRINVAAGDTVSAGQIVAVIEEQEVEATDLQDKEQVDLDRIRPDLAEVFDRLRFTLDETRPDAVEKRRKTGQRTARENVEDLCDTGSFSEYGAMVVAAQKIRRTQEDLIKRTPADGLVAGVGHINGDRFPKDKSRCVVLAYDYTVLAGTQGIWNHEKKDRMLEMAEKHHIPVCLFTEGGGGRPGDDDLRVVSGLTVNTFYTLSRLSGLVPVVGINSGKCFAGNAVLLSICDVVIATLDSNIGLGGPAMIEGGGLGVFRPEEIGPVDVQVPNGDVDIVAKDEADAVAAAKKYLSYFQGPVSEWEAADQRQLRNMVPENRVQIYDIREVIEVLADKGSVLELRRFFGLGIITAFIRIEGRPIGLVANNPAYLSGAVDAPGSDKASRFMKLCDAFDIPILVLCDTPGFMVGPENEKSAMLRHAGRLFVNGANLTVPMIGIVLRKGYGLGAQAMVGGSLSIPFLTVSWPTGEFGGMGLEGFVKLGFRKEIAAIEDPAERMAFYQQMVDKEYEKGKAINVATHFEIDGVIDPADSRETVISALDVMPAPPLRTEKKYPSIDTW